MKKLLNIAQEGLEENVSFIQQCQGHSHAKVGRAVPSAPPSSISAEWRGGTPLPTAFTRWRIPQPSGECAWFVGLPGSVLVQVLHQLQHLADIRGKVAQNELAAAVDWQNGAGRFAEWHEHRDDLGGP